MPGLFGSIRWKLDELAILRKNEKRLNPFLEAFSRKYRKDTYEIYRILPLQIAESMGLKFSSEMNPMSLKEMFADEAYKVPGFLPGKDDVVIDIGANVGDSALWWWVNFGSKVIAFEPLKKTFNILSENVKLNRADIEVHNVALGNGSPIYGDSEGTMFSINGERNLETERLDDLNLKKVDIVKIDVEGFELDVIHGAFNTLSKFKPKIIIETHSNRLRAICHEMLSKLGYELKVEGRTVISNTPGMDKVTNLFYSV